MLRHCRYILLFALLAWPATAQDRHVSAIFNLLRRREMGQAMEEAVSARNSLLYKYVQWVSLRAPDATLDFDSLRSFVDANPDWPDMSLLIRRAEIAIITSDVDNKQAKEWFKRHPPATQLGKLLAADVKKGGDIPASLIRQAWVEGDFSADREKAFLKEHGKLIRPEDDMARASRLVWENKFTMVKRMTERLNAPYRQVIKTRMELRSNARTAPYSVAHAPKHYANDPGLLFDRIMWRNAKGDDDGVRELLMLAPEKVPYPEKWWPLRERATRAAIEEKQYKLARKLISKHGITEEGAPLQDALWLSGWLYLQFENHPDKAYKEFLALDKIAHTPHSKTRADYWAGRAAEKNGKPELAKKHYLEAAQYQTTFYGQLAHLEVHKHASLKLPAKITISAEQKAAFRQKELARMALLLAKLGQTDLARPFLLELAADADTPAKAKLVADLGKDLGRNDYMIMAAKRAFQNGQLSVDNAYPMPGTPPAASVEKALILGLSRQESQMYEKAVSPSGAIGLMQLMPATAKETAHKAGIAFATARLYEPAYNMQLGTLYLGSVLNRFENSYVLAAAAYNAGPGRVKSWIKRFGPPGPKYRDTVDWIEKIPFSETRTYVQRVLENTQVYRELLNPDSGFELSGDLESK